jgi:uncharacterized protein
MRIGILSDTHGRTEALVPAIDMLRGHGAERFIHCGDVGGEAVLDALAGLTCTFVWGNNDYDTASLVEYAKTLGLTCGGRFVELEIGGKRIAVLHGDDGAAKRQLLDGQAFDYVLQGHTHVWADQRFGRTRLINPGALYRANPKTVALLDLDLDRLDRIIVAP